MKKLILFLISFVTVNLQAQNVTFDWVKQMGGTGEAHGISIALDKSGNIYTTGFFVGTIDFDPGPAIFNLTSIHSDDVFVCKTDANGNLIWAKQMGGFGWAQGNSICIDATGNLFITGDFAGTVDFDPGGGVFSMTTVIGVDYISRNVFLCKLDANGNFIWAKQIGGLTETSYCSGLYSTLDSAGNIFTTGSFWEIADFDPGVGVFNLFTSGFADDVFISKLDANGNFIWAKQMAGGVNGYGYGASITLDGFGSIYTTGSFTGIVDFDPGIGVYNFNSISGRTFILKLDGNGNFIWAKQMGTDNSSGTSLTTDAIGNVYAAGVFLGTGDFDPGPGVYNLSGIYDVFVSKFDTAGNLIWVKQIGGNAETEVGSIILDASGNIYTTGYFRNTTDFDPGTCVFNLSSHGYYDFFISKLDPSGNFLWVKQMGGSQYAKGNSIALDPLQNLYTTGYFESTTDFDPGFSVYNLSSVDFSMFIHKMDPCTNRTTSTINITTCSPYTIGCKTYTTSGAYTVILENAKGCDSIVTLKLTISDQPVRSAITASACNKYLWNGQTYTTSGVYRDTLVTINGCDSIVTLDLTITNVAVRTFITASACTRYLWNGQTYTTSGVYPDTLITINGCDSIVTLNLTIANIPVRTFVNASACTRYVWNNRTYTSSGIYADTLVAANSCDSIVTLYLTINNTSLTSFSASVCNSYTWNNRSYTASGIYYDTLIATNGCDSITILQLTIKPGSYSSINQTICQGQSYYGYSINGNYIDTLMSTNGCDSIRTIRLTVLPKPAPVLGIDKDLCSGDSIILYPGQFNSYLWQDGSTRDNLIVTQSGYYSVTVTGNCGVARDDILIKDGICGIWFPSAFTPNYDGRNDLFKALGKLNVSEYYLSVYNRWGQKIFETNDYTNGWNGKFKEQLQETGIYIWYCSFKKVYDSKKVVLKGTVLLTK